MIKPNRIVATDLCHSHPGQRAHRTDAFYVQLANQLLNDFWKAHIDLGENTAVILRYTAVSLASYMEDVVADSGQWRMFSTLCQKMFGWPVPMYHDADEEYYPDEPSIFQYRVGPLALYAKDWLAELMRTRKMTEAAADMEAIERIPAGAYKYTVSADGKTLYMEHTNGRRLQLAREEITLTDSQLRQYDACTATFVSYQGAWHMNGAMMPFKHDETHWKQICEKASDYIPKGLTIADAKWYLERTGGKQMLFFAGKKEAEDYLKNNMMYVEGATDFLASSGYAGQPIMMFIDGNDAQGILQFTFGFTPCIAAPDNPFYDEDIARQEAVEMLWNDDSIGTGAMLYMLDHGYLPEILTDDQLCQNSTYQEKESDVRFLLRYMRREKY